MLRATCLALLVIGCASLASAQNAGEPPRGGPPAGAAKEIREVIVYRGQAQVTRAVPLPAADAGKELELVVGDLPEQIVPASVSAAAEGKGLTIRYVRFRSHALAAAPQKEIADLDEQVKKVTADIYANGQLQALEQAKQAYVAKLEGFAAPTASVEMSKGVLNPDTLAKVSDMILKLRSDLAGEQIKLHEAAGDLAEKLNLLQRKRSEMAGGGKTLREAVIYVTREDGAAGPVLLSYTVGSADWTPAYNLRLAEDGKTAKLEYLAQVQQASGEDWKDVKLTLSTATPAMNADSPLLVPLWLTLSADGVGKGKTSLLDGSNKQYGMMGVWNARQQAPEQAGWELNRAAAGSQIFELNGQLLQIKAGQDAVEAMTQGLAVSYPLPGKMTLASRPDQQLVQIAAVPLTADSYFEAIPLLSTYVYRRANLVNTSDLPMLAGPYSAYVGGEFVGRGDMPLVARGQTLNVGFGVDTQLRCRRELKDKSERISWGSMVQTFTYELRLENFKKTPVVVRLLDRIPASKTEDLQIKLLKPGEALSADAVYARDYKDKGILRWDIDLPGESAGAKVRRIEYSFEMKYAKDAHVGREAAALPAAMQEDFRLEMQKAAR